MQIKMRLQFQFSNINFIEWLKPLNFCLILAKNSIEIYLNTGGQTRTRCSFAYNNRKTGENMVCYQIRDNYSQSISDPHIISSKKLSVGLRR